VVEEEEVERPKSLERLRTAAAQEEALAGSK